MAFGNPSAFTAPNPVGFLGVTPVGPVTLVASEVKDVSDLLAPFFRGLQGDIQSVWLDASAASDPVLVRAENSRQYTIWPAGWIGWQQLLVPMPGRIQLLCVSAATVFLNVATGVISGPMVDGGSVLSRSRTTVTSVAAAAADTAILAVNTARQGFSLFNDSTATLKLLNGGSGAASATNFSVEVAPRAYFESPYKFGGAARGIWSAANGSARVTEYL